MAGYHPYVFDEKKQVFVGRFEDMYRAESTEGFDSWRQEDQRELSKKVCLAILENYSFARILDIGCGKGLFTQFLKKMNNYVRGIDISPTALDTARTRYSDIDFVEGNIASEGILPFIGEKGAHYDLVVCLETLSYLRNWQQIIADCAKLSGYILIALFLPENPIGFVKTAGELVASFDRNFHIIEDIRFVNQERIILFGKSRLCVK